MTMGERIRLRREQIGMAQIELAEKIGDTKQNIYKYETGIVTNIPLPKIEAIAYALDVKPSWLVGWNIDYTVLSGPIPAVKLGLIDENCQKLIESYAMLEDADRERADDYITYLLDKRKR